MINYAEILSQNPNGVLATREGEGIKTRVFQYLFSEENKVYFCTNSQKPVYEQLMENQNVSYFPGRLFKGYFHIWKSGFCGR